MDVSLTSNNIAANNGYYTNKYVNSSRGKALQNYVTQAGVQTNASKSMNSVRDNGKDNK